MLGSRIRAVPSCSSLVPVRLFGLGSCPRSWGGRERCGHGAGSGLLLSSHPFVRCGMALWGDGAWGAVSCCSPLVPFFSCVIVLLIPSVPLALIACPHHLIHEARRAETETEAKSEEDRTGTRKTTRIETRRPTRRIKRDARRDEKMAETIRRTSKQRDGTTRRGTQDEKTRRPYDENGRTTTTKGDEPCRFFKQAHNTHDDETGIPFHPFARPPRCWFSSVRRSHIIPRPRGVGGAGDNKLASRRRAFPISSAIVSSLVPNPSHRPPIGVVAVVPLVG